MADKMYAEVVIAGSYKNLSKSTKGAKKELVGFEKAAKKISGAIKGAFAGIAVGGLNDVFDAIVDVTKAAAQDTKSIALLNKQMENSWKANDKTKKSMNEYLDTLSNMTGILDDDLRPAFAKIVRSTKSPTKAMKAFNMVMDISAGTGKDVNTVAAAYSKYLTGNKTALERLLPGLKNAGNEAEYLKSQFDGMAGTAGQNDPFARINAVMENFKEKIGLAFLPMANSFADWLAGDDSQKMMDDIAKWVTDLFAWFTSPEGRATIQKWIEDIAALLTPLGEMMSKASVFMNNKGGTERLIYDQLGVGSYYDKLKGYDKTTTPTVPSTLKNITSQGTSTIINITGAVSGNDVLKALQNIANKKGVPMSRLLG